MPRKLPAKPQQSAAERFKQMTSQFEAEQELCQLALDQQAKLLEMRYHAMLKNTSFTEERVFALLLAHVRGQN
jgi:hypothetical protein